MTEFKKNLSAAALFIVLGGFLSWRAFGYAYESSAFLRTLSVALMVMGIIYLMSVLARRPTPETPAAETPTPATAVADSGTSSDQPTVGGVPMALLVFGLVGGYILAIMVTGFLVATILFTYIGQVCIARRHRMLYLIYAVGLAAFIFLVFFNLLGVALPTSTLPIDRMFRFL